MKIIGCMDERIVRIINGFESFWDIMFYVKLVCIEKLNLLVIFNLVLGLKVENSNFIKFSVRI